MTQHNTPRLIDGWKRNRINGPNGRGGEVTQYRIDKEHYKKCTLDKFVFVKKYFISKGETIRSLGSDPLKFSEDAILYVAVSDGDELWRTPEHQLNHPYLGFRTCSEGKHPLFNYVRLTSVEKTSNDAKRCGLSTILAYLCYRDREVERSIMGTAETGYDFLLESKKSGSRAKIAAKKLKIFANRKCKRIIKVSIPAGKDRTLGRAYITAGMDAGYEFLITFNTKNPLRKIFVISTEKLVKSFEEKPASDPVVGNAVDPVLDEFVDNYGNDWFLCKKYRFFKDAPN